MVRLRRKGKKISNPCRNLKKLLHLSSKIFVIIWILSELFIPLHRFRKTESNMVAVVQLVRASDCGSECRRFESDQPPQNKKVLRCKTFFYYSPFKYKNIGRAHAGLYHLM